MRRNFHWVTIVALVGLALAAGPAVTAQSQPPPPAEIPRDLPSGLLACDAVGTQTSGALYQICMPAAWNGDLALYAHGYISPLEPLQLPAEAATLAAATNSLGYAFAVTSYSANGLAVVEALADLRDLVQVFSAAKGTPNRVYLLGASEGGLITTLAVERYPDVFDAGLATCGPYGDFQAQIDYFGDFRVVFDYFFPALLPGSPISVPVSLMQTWPTHYATVVRPAITDPSNASKVQQLLDVTGAAYDPADPATREQTIGGVLWYSIFATGDAQAKLGGQPFDNHDRVYAGSQDDAQLNAGVERFTADPAARAAIAANYQTTGRLSVPLITMHTTGDPVIPFWHVNLYTARTIRADNIALHRNIAIQRYGHCAFNELERLNAFMDLVSMVNTPPAYQPVKRVYLPIVVRAPHRD